MIQCVFGNWPEKVCQSGKYIQRVLYLTKIQGMGLWYYHCKIYEHKPSFNFRFGRGHLHSFESWRTWLLNILLEGIQEGGLYWVIQMKETNLHCWTLWHSSVYKSTHFLLISIGWNVSEGGRAGWRNCVTASNSVYWLLFLSGLLNKDPFLGCLGVRSSCFCA